MFTFLLVTFQIDKKKCFKNHKCKHLCDGCLNFYFVSKIPLFSNRIHKFMHRCFLRHVNKPVSVHKWNTCFVKIKSLRMFRILDLLLFLIMLLWGQKNVSQSVFCHNCDAVALLCGSASFTASQKLVWKHLVLWLILCRPSV